MDNDPFEAIEGFINGAVMGALIWALILLGVMVAR